MAAAKILIQNQNLKLSAPLHNALIELGHTVLTVTTRRGLINIADTYKPELIIIDGNIAETDTAEDLEILRNSVDVKILATSCSNKNSMIAKGFDGCLAHPYESKNIRKIIDNIIRQPEADIVG